MEVDVPKEAMEVETRETRTETRGALLSPSSPSPAADLKHRNKREQKFSTHASLVGKPSPISLKTKTLNDEEERKQMNSTQQK